MAAITAAMVKDLRDQTQLPMMECKKALNECDGDVAAAIQMLRERGKKLMGTRDDRSTEEGRIAIFTDFESGVGSMIELQCESAPVASNDEFIQLTKDLAETLAKNPSVNTPEELWALASPSRSGITLEVQKDELQNKIREVFRLPRILRIEQACGGYVHHDGKSSALLAVEGSDVEASKEICMHITAMRPKVLATTDMDSAEVEQERNTLIEAARKEGKPENILEKMVEGRMRNFYAEHVLSEQAFIKDDKQTVGKFAESKGIKMSSFVRWQLGESLAS